MAQTSILIRAWNADLSKSICQNLLVRTCWGVVLINFWKCGVVSEGHVDMRSTRPFVDLLSWKTKRKRSPTVIQLMIGVSKAVCARSGKMKSLWLRRGWQP